MGHYYNPPSNLPNVGKELIPSSYDGLVQQLNSDEHLYGLYDRGPFMNAAHLFSSDEMEAFDSQVRRGIIFRVGYYALHKDISQSPYPVEE